MSVIRVDNFGPSTGGTSYSARGITKAWVNFNGTGTIAARDSENVSSLTDNGTGDYTVTFSSAFDAVNFGMFASHSYDTDPHGFSYLGCQEITTTVTNAVRTGVWTTSTTLFDVQFCCVSTLGDLA